MNFSENDGGFDEGSGFEQGQFVGLRTVAGLAATVSLVGSISIVALYHKYKRQDMRMLAWLSAFDAFADVATLGAIAAGTTDQLCGEAALLLTMAELSPVLWTACVSAAMCISVFVSSWSGKRGVEYLNCFLFIVFCTCIAVGLSANYEHVFGISELGLCSVKRPLDRLYYFYAPLWFVACFNTAIYCAVEREYTASIQASHGSLSASSSAVKAHRLKYYPIIIILAWSVASANELLTLITGDMSYPLAVLHLFLAKSNGWLNAAVYMTDPLQDFWPTAASLCCGTRGSTVQEDSLGWSDVQDDHMAVSDSHSTHAFEMKRLESISSSTYTVDLGMSPNNSSKAAASATPESLASFTDVI
ncbi:Cyclic AMP receptor-like protein A [Diplonema papillatum]|nr:Cyclic AMP receptor-like protein A [Diplonema papillatum]